MSRTPEEIKAHNASYRKQRKNSFKERGICPNCEKRSSAPGKVCCIQCLEDKKLTQKFGTAGPYRQIYGDLFERQQGLCGICRRPMEKPVLDHSHATMEVRGLLCSRCNIGLGQFQDDPVILASALRYIDSNAGIGITIIKRKNT
jgi:Recombination endonuclease VII